LNSSVKLKNLKGLKLIAYASLGVQIILY
jgi:hypothetical protein